jgi:hypothetical protein
MLEIERSWSRWRDEYSRSEDDLDFKNILLEEDYLEVESLERFRSSELSEGFVEEEIKAMFTKVGVNLKPEVIQWLEDNVKDRDTSRFGDEESSKGWCVGNAEYRNRESYNGMSIWFHRKKDLLAFVREWSEFKVPTTAFNYDKMTHREIYGGRLRKVNIND